MVLAILFRLFLLTPGFSSPCCGSECSRSAAQLCHGQRFLVTAVGTYKATDELLQARARQREGFETPVACPLSGAVHASRSMRSEAQAGVFASSATFFLPRRPTGSRELGHALRRSAAA